MKRFLSLIAAVLLTGATVLTAQQKFGYVNSQEILFAMPEVTQMQQAMEQKSNEYRAQLETKYADYEEKYTFLVENQETMMPAVFEQKMQELQSLETTIMNLEEKIQEDLAAYEESLYLPIENKAVAAINTVAQANGYSYVFDLAAGSLVYYPEGDNITPLVKRELGITN